MELQHFGYCPQCLKTAYWQSDETKEMTCEWCDRTFVYDGEIDKFMDTDTNEIVKRKASDEMDRLLDIALNRYDTHVIHLNREQQQKAGFEEGQRGAFVTKENGQSLILLDGSSDENDRIIILSHELGHAANFQNDYKRDHKTWLNHVDLNRFNGAHSVMLREQSAWRYAHQLLKEVSFSNWNNFFSMVSYNIGSYYETVWKPYRAWFFKEYDQKPVQYFPDKEEFLKSLV